jgi:hypothetical protein
MIKKLIFLLLLTTLTFNHITFSIKIDLQSKIKLSEKVLLQLPISFCVTEDESFLLVDFKAGDVKIYNNKGALEKVLGRRGAGPNEFLQPLFCDYNNRKFIIPDAGQRKIFLYDKVGKFKFERTREILYANIGEDIQLREKKIYMSGNKNSGEGKYYSFYSFDLDKKGHHIYFLPSYLKFGLSSENEYKTEYLKKPNRTAIGVTGRFDIHGDFAYYVWEGDLKIFKINLKTKEITTFGKKMPHYVKPYTTQKLINAFFNMQGNFVQKERNKMSYVRQIFTTKKHVILLYTVPVKNGSGHEYMVQTYKMDGNFVEESKFPGKAPDTIWFDKKNSILYILALETDKEIDESYHILKYKFHDNDKSKNKSWGQANFLTPLRFQN